jgi:hypothetical protein
MVTYYLVSEVYDLMKHSPDFKRLRGSFNRSFGPLFHNYRIAESRLNSWLGFREEDERKVDLFMHTVRTQLVSRLG